jgi:hypothetical protein
MNVEIATLSRAEEARAQEFIVELDYTKTKHKGDPAWREIEQITGGGDYHPADEGEPPQGAYENN